MFSYFGMLHPNENKAHTTKWMYWTNIMLSKNPRIKEYILYDRSQCLEVMLAILGEGVSDWGVLAGTTGLLPVHYF